MNAISTNYIRTVAVMVLAICLCTTVRAQKAENVQTAPIWVPAVKIDGKANDWDAPMANNKSTELLYTLANDDKNLYLLIQSPNLEIANRIMLGGVTLTINTDNVKKTKNAPAITYLLIDRNNPSSKGSYNPNAQAMTREQRDSSSIAIVRTRLATAKDVKILGIKGITDSLVSIYNEYGIMVASSVDAKGILISELAVPLELLNLSAIPPKEFSYNIMVNGRVLPASMSSGMGGGITMTMAGSGGSMGAMLGPADFWGKYTLAAKK